MLPSIPSSQQRPLPSFEGGTELETQQGTAAITLHLCDACTCGPHAGLSWGLPLYQNTRLLDSTCRVNWLLRSEESV